MYIDFIFSKGFRPLLWGLMLGSCLGFPLMSVQAQVYEGDLTLSTQAQVDAFAYTEVRGNLTIKETSITNLSALSQLTAVGGRLIISSNDALTNLDGLAAIQLIGGKLNIYNNDALTNLDGLAALQSIGGYLLIRNNDALTNLDGLAALQSIGEYLHISSNDALTNLDGLAALQSIGGYLSIYDNDALTNLDGLAALQSIGGYLSISSNKALTNLDGLSGIQSVGGELNIFNNDVLTNLDGLVGVQSVGEAMNIQNNDILTNLDGLAALQSIGGDLNISSNDKLNEFCGLYPLLKEGNVEGRYTVWDNKQNPSREAILDSETCAAQFACSLDIYKIRQNDESCIGTQDGKLMVLASGEGGGGVPPEYTQDGGITWQRSFLFDSLSPGDYQIGVRFPNLPSCSTAIQTQTIQAGTKPRPTLTATTTKSNCLGDTDGTITLTANRPAGSHLFYSLNDEPFLAGGPTYTYIHQGAGDHRVVVKDLNGCNSEVLEVKLLAHPRPTFKVTVKQDASGLLTEDGQLHIEPINVGAAHYAYSLDDGATYEDDPSIKFGIDIAGLNAGAYDIRIKDDNGCVSEHRHVTVNDLSQCTTRTALANKYNFVYSGNGEKEQVCEGNPYEQKYTVSNLAEGERFRLDWAVEETFGQVNEHSTFNEIIPTPDAIRGSQGPYAEGGIYTFDAGGGILGMEDYAKHNDTMHFTLTPVIILPDGQECHGDPVDEYAYVYPSGRIRLQNAKQPGQTIVIASGEAPNGTFKAIAPTQFDNLQLLYQIDIEPTEGITELSQGFEAGPLPDLSTPFEDVEERKLNSLTNTTSAPIKVTVKVTPVAYKWEIDCQGQPQSIDIWVKPGS